MPSEMALWSQGAFFLFAFLKDNFPNMALESEENFTVTNLAHGMVGGPGSSKLWGSESLGLGGLGEARGSRWLSWVGAGALEPSKYVPGLSGRPC